MQNLSEDEFSQIAEMHGQSQEKLKQIAKIRRIKNYEKMKKKDLISLLKSKQSIAELFNNNNNDNNNNNNNNNVYDNEISGIRRILSRLRDTIPKKDRKEIRDKLYKIEHQGNISKTEK